MASAAQKTILTIVLILSICDKKHLKHTPNWITE